MALLCRICCYLGLHGKAGYAAECGGAILRLLLELLDSGIFAASTCPFGRSLFSFPE